ncbi:MAG: hypothetical protein H5T82_03310 [Demequina sp.]|uniref:hypothetical protein n=1 Tax=Demequina sp. TaxID=2050685 RepID=UPI0019B99727|nr:hypothetical protein [Demequina sp.]MBC7297901.1 hypothetical protein [Demequina sp.]
MAFEEAFNPGMARAREELERESILPAPPPVTGSPLAKNETPGITVPDAGELAPFAPPSGRRAHSRDAKGWQSRNS